MAEARDCTRDVPADRWDPAVFYDPDSTANDRVYCRRGGYLDDPIEFDPAQHGVVPSAVAGGEPEQYLVLDAAKAALADAGLASPVAQGHRVEVVIGRGNYFNRGNLTRLQHGRIVAQTLAILEALHPEWTAAELEAVRADLKSSLPPFDPSTITGQLTSATAGRVANRLDLAGASFVVDAASASSLVALDLGARALVEGRADLALVGGVYIAPDVDFSQVFCQLGALSRRGEARPFARDADGTLPGEGVGVVVLKRLRDAEADGDRVYAVLKGVGLASDGRCTGLATPSARGHARAIRRAYRRSGVDPASVDLVEGHGLGVPASDRAELRALRAVFPMPRWGRRNLGAVSSLIGHAMPAAGMAGLIKSALALHHRTLPPAGHGGEPHPLLAGPDSAFELKGTLRPWIHGERAHPRRAGVNAFGFAGVSAHAVLEEHAASDGRGPGPQQRWETEAILLGAADREAWLERASRLQDWLERGHNLDVALKDLAATLNAEAMAEPFRLGLVVKSPADLRDRLRYLRERLSDPSCSAIRDARGSYFWERPLAKPGALAFLFPGEGSQYAGMLADLCLHFPEVRQRFDIADRVARERGFAHLPSQVLFDQAREPDGSLWTVGTAINVVLSSQWGLHQLLVRLGLRPDAVLGHSSGEFLTLAAAGALSVDHQLEAGLGELGRVFERLEASGHVPSARLVAVAADRDRVEQVCQELGIGSTIAIDNCPHQVVVACTPAAADAVVKRLKAQGLVCEYLPFERAYHTPTFASALGPVRAFFKDLDLRPPQVNVYSCAVACQLSGDVEQLRRVAVEQWALPVAFRATIESMYADGIRVFVEVGARGNLTGFVEDTLRDRPHFAVAANLPRRSGLTQLNHLVASLYAQGVALRPDYLYERRRPQRIDLEHDLPEARRGPALAVGFPEMALSPALVERLRGARAAAAVRAEVELPAMHAAPALGTSRYNGHVEPPASPAPADAAPAPARRSPREEAVLAHLKTMDAFLETQRQVMGAYRAARTQAPSGRRPAEGAPTGGAGAAAGPWVGTIERLVPGRELVAVRRLDEMNDPVADNHTLGGRRVSALDPSRKGLPVVPFTVMAEMLAQAAAVLVPEGTLVALRDVHAHKWIRYEAEPVALELRAVRDPSTPDRVRVVIVNKATSGRKRAADEGPVVQGEAVFAPAREPGPPAPPFHLKGARASRFTAQSVYDEQWLFHGPAMQAIARIGGTSSQGIEGTLKVLPRAALLQGGDARALRTDPIVLDAFTQLLGCWGLDTQPEGDVIFPLRVGEIAFFGPDPPEGAEVACRIAVREVSRHLVRVDADLVGPEGGVWVRIRGWEDWRFYWPNRCRDQFRQADKFFVGEPLALPGAPASVAKTAVAVWMEPPVDLGRPVWRDVLEWVQLGPDERVAARTPGLTDHAWTLRLWGRVAAKEAARRLWSARGGGAVYPADLAVEVDAQGRHRLRSLGEPSRTDMPAIVIAQAEGAALALASLDPYARLGLALETIAGPAVDAEMAAIGPRQRALLDTVARGGQSREEWLARFRCARSAALQMLGNGSRDEPDLAVVTGADPRSGEVAVTFDAASVSLPPGWDRSPVRGTTARKDDHVWAWGLRQRGAR